MSLQTIEQALRAAVSPQNELTFAAIGAQVTSLGVVLTEIPPVADFPIQGAKLTLAGADASQSLTIGGTVDWGLLKGTTATIVVTVDPSAADAYLCSVTLAAPTSAAIAIPGVSWFQLGAFTVGARSTPAGDRAGGLLAAAVSDIGTTVIIQGESSKTAIPIVIENDPTGSLLLRIDSSAIELPSINDVLSAFGGGASAIQLPSTINDLAHFSVLDLYVRYDPSSKTVQQIGIDVGNSDKQPDGWPIIPGFLALVSYQLGLNIVDPLGTKQVGGMVAAKTKLGAVEIDVAAAHPASGGWSFEGYIGNEVRVGDLVDGLVKQFGVTLPDVLHSFDLEDFTFGFDTQSLSATGAFTLKFTVAGKDVTLAVTASITRQDKKYVGAATGTLTIGTSVFTTTFSNATDTIFSAEWSDDKNPLEFADIAAMFGFTNVPAIPASLDLSLVEASFTYDFTAGDLVLTAKSANEYYGDAVFVAHKAKTGSQYFFGVHVNETLDLTNLPLVKSVLSADERVTIDHIQAVVASAAFDAAAAKEINALITDATLPRLPDAGIDAGVNLSMQFHAGSYEHTFSLSTAGGKKSSMFGSGDGTGHDAGNGIALRTLTATPGEGSDDTVQSAASSDGTMWYNLQKKFGPVTFQKVGVRYRSSTDGKDGILSVLMNAGLDAGGLTIDVMGLGLGSPLDSFQPHFNIDGLAVTLSEGPVEVSGGMIGTIDPSVNFYGELVLGFEALTVSALGGYAEYQQHPSFFLYATVDYPIGGPAFFFVTGLAAGMGFNRKLAIPDITAVGSFPLVQWARGSGSPGMDPTASVGDQVVKVVGILTTSGVVAPEIGEYWLAMGVRFTSFELVDSFALLTVAFGTRFEVDLLGLSVLALPPGTDTPVARAELALKASFVPALGVLSIEAQLTQNSYVLAQACHLTGGFAFYVWYAGEHEGDFVVTLGGYNPNFTVPKHYPVVPRLGLNWQMDGFPLTITGQMYFALTSNAVMAGGELSAVWESGPISAWFTVWADFLMVFKPFHYYISAGIDLGAAFTVKILFVHVRFSVHVGVGLQIWGPEFAGVATVHLWIISFDINFGSGSPSTDTHLEWRDFVEQLLPSAPPPPATKSAPPRYRRTVLTDLPSDTSPQPIVRIAVTQGLVATIDPSTTHPWYLVSGETFQAQVTTAIPFKVPAFAGNVALAPDAMQPQDENHKPIVPNTSFSGGAAGIAAKDFNPKLTLQLDATEDSQVVAVNLLRNAPKALWDTKQFSNGVPQLDPSTGLTDSTLPNVLQGYSLVPVVPDPDHTLEIPLESLEFTLQDTIGFAWSAPTWPTTDTLAGKTVAGTITDPAIANIRGDLLTAIEALGFDIEAEIDVASLEFPENNDLMAAPRLSLLGEQSATALAGV